ncbi:glycosyltransferase [Kitasatospora sp. NBC_01287]|uniref:glycosyltransferase family 2 protein n=1 Tax=Kitasatospora sp. NBC_01287 TaxID=2903573 RepID=UPI002255D4F8|nr:glycosyltransferase [Kitasatospora sp. NBC_01287]MCX4748471.1 glycosyltransferase [Kitasatospora sp. NBC_01287]
MSVDFVIPYYGDPEYLFATIDSVRAQHRQDWRLTIVDDGYPGNRAFEYIQTLGDDRIRYQRNDERLGPNGNTYKASQLAEREFVCMMGADDLLEPDYLDVVLERLEADPQAIMVQPGVRLMDSDGNLLPSAGLGDKVKHAISSSARKAGRISGEAAVKGLLAGNWLYTPSLTYRQSALSKIPYRPDIDACHDLAFVVDMLMDGGTLLVDPREVFRYRRHQASDSSQRAKDGKRFDEEARYYALIADELRGRGWNGAARAADLHLTSRLHALMLAVGRLGAGDFAHAGTMAGKALRGK